MKVWVSLGCSIVGGCCGVFPEHIKPIADYNRLINFALDDKAESKYNAMMSQKDIRVEDLPKLDPDTLGVHEQIGKDTMKLESVLNELNDQYEVKKREVETSLEEQRTAEMMLEDMLSHVILNTRVKSRKDLGPQQNQGDDVMTA